MNKEEIFKVLGDFDISNKYNEIINIIEDYPDIINEFRINNISGDKYNFLMFLMQKRFRIYIFSEWKEEYKFQTIMNKCLNICDAKYITNLVKTTLYTSINYGQFHLFPTLLQKGADPLKCDYFGDTLLHVFCIHGYMATSTNNYFTIIKSIIQLGVDVNAKECKGKTAIDFLLEKSRDFGYVYFFEHIKKIINILLYFGAKPNDSNNIIYMELTKYKFMLDFTKIYWYLTTKPDTKLSPDLLKLLYEMLKT